MRSQAIPYLCVAGLLTAFAIDLATPQLFVAAILLDVPIVLSSFSGDRRFTGRLVVAALAADAIAGYVNGVTDHYHWDPIGIGDRMLSGLSIALIGYLTTVVQENAQRIGALSVREARSGRERKLRSAVEAVRASLNPEIVERAIVRESVAVLDGAFARFYLLASTNQNPTTLASEVGAEDVAISIERPPPPVTSLVQRVFEGGDAIVVERSDPLGRLVLDTLSADAALAAPIVDGSVRFGVLVVAGAGASAIGEGTVEVARRFVEQAGIALAQSRLFVQLAERNEELAAANRSIAERSDVIRDIVYALSHDLRTPLVAIGMTMRQALDGAYGELPEAYREILRRTIVASDELQRLSENLLLVARMESGDYRARHDTVRLDEAAASVAAQLDVVARARAQSIVIADETPPGGACVIADPGDIRRVMTNLVANAMGATPDGGTIVIRLHRDGDAMLVSIEDDGYGVPPEIRAALFERFVESNSRRGGGTGIGLYIVRMLVQSYGGTVSYAAREPRGSTFTIALPAAPLAVSA